MKSKIIKLATGLFLTLSSKTFAEAYFEYGLNWKQGYSKTFGGFIEYKHNTFLGIATGLEYTRRDFILVNNKSITDTSKLKNIFSSESMDWDNDTKDNILKTLKEKIKSANLEDDGLHFLKYLTVPIIANIYISGGGFCLSLGLAFNYLLSVNGFTPLGIVSSANNLPKEEIKKLKNIEDNVLSEYKNPDDTISSVKGFKEDSKYDDGTNVYNKLAIKFIWGLKHNFSIGLVLGLEGRHSLRSFVNLKGKKDGISKLEGNFKFILGWNIAKTIQAFSSNND